MVIHWIWFFPPGKIRRRLYSMINYKHNRKEPEKNFSYFIIPYVSSIAKKFIKYYKNISFCKLVSRVMINWINSLKISFLLSRSNVVYKINCLNCDASYVGQTKRTLNTRVADRRNHIRKDTVQVFVITTVYSQTMSLIDVRVLDEEMNYKKRLISEIIYIKKQKHGLNSQNDTELLDPIYNDLLLCNKK